MNQGFKSLILCLALTSSPLPTGLASAAEAVAKPGAPAEEEALSRLLEQAEAARASGHLIYPVSGSAMALYQEAALLAPDSAEARRGLERLVEHFLTEASAAMARDQLIKAGSMLSKARMVDRDNPNIKPLAAELRLLEEATRHRTTLDWRLVAERSAELSPTLKRIGARAREPGCRAVISAGNDAEGRWIYGQLSQAPGERRIQAQIRIASPSAVEVLCFAATL